MSEIQEILSFYEQCLREERRCALATVIRTSGPSYRSVGARSIICDDGSFRGGLSAGCLESDIACRLDGEKKSFIVDYDLSAEDDIRGFPFGCGGSVEILVEPLPNSQAMHAVEWFASLDLPAVLLTVLSSDGGIDAGARYGMNTTCDSTYHGKLKFPGMEGMALDVLAARRSKVVDVEINGKKARIFAEYYEPAISVYVFGDGEDARILETAGGLYGLTVTRVSRNDLRTSEQLVKVFPNLAHSFSVVMTHDLNIDTDVVHQLVSLNPPYLGIMGPRSRSEKIFKSFEPDLQEAISATNVFSPIGLDLGAETPREIALSILAEIHTIARNRFPRHLRDVDAAIHERETSIASAMKCSIGLSIG